MRSYTVEGIVLKRSNFREADRLITLYTHDHGKLTCLAKGVRRSTSRRQGQLELFNHVRVKLIPTHGPDILTEVQLLNSHAAWKKHLGRITLAYHLAEAIDKLTPDSVPQPQVFYLLMSYLNSIAALGAQWQTITNQYLVQLLQELGFWPHDQLFTSDPVEFIEAISQKHFHSPKLLAKLARQG